MKKSIVFLAFGILLSLNSFASEVKFSKIPLKKTNAYISMILVPMVATKVLGCVNFKNVVSCRYISDMDSRVVPLFKKAYATQNQAYDIAQDAQNEIDLANAQGDKKILFGLDAKGNPVFKSIR